MTCIRKEKTGMCSHFQCPFSDETPHGYQCVDLFGGYCEVGEGCLEKCDHSFKDGDETAHKIMMDEIIATTPPNP